MTITPAIPDTDRIVSYSATSNQTDFVIPWVVIADSEDAALNDFGVDVNGIPLDLSLATFVGNGVTGESGIWNGGTLTIGARTTSDRVVIYSDRAPRRTSQFLEGKSLPFTTLDQLMDDITIMMRDLSLRSKRAIMLTPEQYLDGGSEDDLVQEILAASAAAVAAAATAAADLALIQAYGIPFSTYRNIFELFTQSEINIIKGGDNSTDLTAKIQAAMTANPNSSWFFPAGTYALISTTLSLPAGIRWIGAGKGVTTIKIGGSPWGIQQLNPNGTNEVKGFCSSAITYLISNNGIRLNSATGGYDDTSGTQYYIDQADLSDNEFLFNSAPGTKILVQLNKVFNSRIIGSKFVGGNVQLDIEGSDLNAVRDNRMDLATDCAILDLSHGTFGSTNDIQHNDINNPKNNFIRTNNLDFMCDKNHMELDGSPGSTGVGGNMEAAIDIITGGAFKIAVTNNRIAGSEFMDRWIRYRGDNPYSLIVTGNGSTDAGTAAADVTGISYFTNSGTRTVCIHNGNLFLGENSNWPLNTMPSDFDAGTVRAALLTASRPGVSNLVGLGVIVGGVKCVSGDFVLAADANTGHYIEFSDWTGWPNNNLIGTFAINLVHYASHAGQVMSWEVLDGASVIASGTVTNTAANTLYIDAILASTAFSTKLKLQIWNADTVNNGNCYLRAAEILLA